MNLVRKALGAAKRRYLHSVSDYYFISFPKSGRTWTKSVLANYYALAKDLPVFHNFAPIRPRAAQRPVPRVIFTHANHLKADDDAMGFIGSLSKKKVVLLVRDPAATTHTFYYRLAKRKQRSDVQAMSLDAFATNDHLGIAQVVRFLNRWFNARASFADFHLLSYERSAANPEREFRALLTFLGEDVDDTLLTKAIARSLDTTRKIESGGVNVDEQAIRDTRIGDAIYLGREEATELKRYSGSGGSLFDVISPEAAATATAALKHLSPKLQSTILVDDTQAESAK